MEYVHQFAARHHMARTSDRWGNLLVQARPGKPRWVMVAHMDHPGLIAGKTIGNGRIQADFHGGVRASHMRGTPVVFFDKGRRTTGKIISAQANERGIATGVVVETNGPVTVGACGMFDFKVAHKRGGLLHSRSLDDTAGVAAALQVLVNVKNHRAGRGAGAAALLTRAEEVGFVGAIAAARDGALLHKNDLIISIECSAMQPSVPQGKGVVIRVGDKTSVFDWEMTYSLNKSAEALAKTQKGFTFQRALMPGGTCEATAFLAYGYRAAALCVPLGNYHNMVAGKKTLGAEYIHLNDWQNLVDLLTHITSSSEYYDSRDLRKSMDQRFAKVGKRFRLSY